MINMISVSVNSLQNIFDLHYSNVRIKDSNNQYSNYEYLPDKRIY